VLCVFFSASLLDDRKGIWRVYCVRYVSAGETGERQCNGCVHGNNAAAAATYIIIINSEVGKAM